MGLGSFIVHLFYTESGLIDKRLFELSDGERWWGARFSMLESRGYRLRERLRPGWVPPWEADPSVMPEFSEHTAHNIYSKITDATRVADGSSVIIKKVWRGSHEKSIALFLSSMKSEKNHCVPIIDTFSDDIDEGLDYIVMPLLRKFNSPPFVAVSEVVDFMQQTLEGIAFMHDLNVAHRDCSDLNIMLDGAPLYPHGFHPVDQEKDRTWAGPAKFVNRSDVPEVRYYFTDFGISTRFTGADENRLVTGCICQVAVPEFSDFVPYDPFAVDIYLLGDVYRRHFISEYSNLQFLSPLVESMVQVEASLRPKANDALTELERLVSQRPDHCLRWKLLRKNSGLISRFVINFKCSSHEGLLLARKLLGFRNTVTKAQKKDTNRSES